MHKLVFVFVNPAYYHVSAFNSSWAVTAEHAKYLFIKMCADLEGFERITKAWLMGDTEAEIIEACDNLKDSGNP
jgi:hypothetical protein